MVLGDPFRQMMMQRDEDGLTAPRDSDVVLDAPTILPSSTSSTVPSIGCDDFGDYELVEELARGGVGIVYKARQRSLNRVVALKMLLTGKHASSGELQRFQSEANAAAKLTHPNIVPIFEVGEANGQQYLSMAYIAGQSLAKRILAAPLRQREAAGLVQSIAGAVHCAHLQGVIHRDLKPANILLDASGTPFVTDFGIAKIRGAGADLTSDGDLIGTPNYMPPEQADGQITCVDVRSDVYSMGAILYALLTGRPPFQAATSLDTIMQVISNDPVPPRQLNPEVSRDLNTITMKCLEKSPARRYSTAEEFEQDLGRYLENEPILARPRSFLEAGLSWCQTHLLAASVSGSAVIFLLSATSIITVGYYREATQRRELEEVIFGLKEQLGKAEQLVEFERRHRRQRTESERIDETGTGDP
ncbi:MAG TPA: hypothetical protein DCY79_03275 [Planctomycetaceae bacterium]|nr:hypothetical protein [Planctomycetaceae bacterium]